MRPPMPVSAAPPKRDARSLRGPRHQRGRRSRAVRIADEDRPAGGLVSGSRRGQRTDFPPARVVWSDAPDASVSAFHLWPIGSASPAGVAVPECHGCGRQCRVFGSLPLRLTAELVLRPDYTDTLTAASAVQREAESLGSDLEAVLSLVASRSQSLLRASGAAIALAGQKMPAP